MNQAGVWGRTFQTKGRPSSMLLRREHRWYIVEQEGHHYGRSTVMGQVGRVGEVRRIRKSWVV